MAYDSDKGSCHMRFRQPVGSIFAIDTANEYKSSVEFHYINRIFLSHSFSRYLVDDSLFFGENMVRGKKNVHTNLFT